MSCRNASPARAAPPRTAPLSPSLVWAAWACSGSVVVAPRAAAAGHIRENKKEGNWSGYFNKKNYFYFAAGIPESAG